MPYFAIFLPKNISLKTHLRSIHSCLKMIKAVLRNRFLKYNKTKNPGYKCSRDPF